MRPKLHLSVASLLSVIAVGLYLLSPAKPSHAANATISLSPASGTVTKGQNIQVTVKLNTNGDPVNAVQANFSYPTDLIDSVTIQDSAAFEIKAQSDASGGQIKIGRGTQSPKSGLVDVATIILHTSNSGTVNLSNAAGSAILRSTDNVDIASTVTGGSFIVSAPTASPSPTPTTTTSKTTTTKSKTTSPSPAPAEPAPAPASPPVISDIQVNGVETNAVVVTWKTDKPSTSNVEYGLSTSYEVAAAAEGKSTDHKVSLDSKLLELGTTYYVRVSSTDDAGNVGYGTTSFKTQGLSVTIQVKDELGNPVVGALVTLGSKTQKTDDQGNAVFSDVGNGQQEVKVSHNGLTTTSKIKVGEKSGGQLLPQTFVVKAASSNIMIQLAVGLIVLGAIIVVLIVAWKKRSLLMSVFGMGGSSNTAVMAGPMPSSQPQSTENIDPLAGLGETPTPPTPGSITHPENSQDQK